jgi:hypothetical protein
MTLQRFNNKNIMVLAQNRMKSNGAEDPYTNPCSYNTLISDKGFSSNGAGKTGYLSVED